MRLFIIGVIIGLLLAASLIFVSLSISLSMNKQAVSVSVTTVGLNGESLNYNAYDIRGPGTSTITLSYSYASNSGSGKINMSLFGLQRMFEVGSKCGSPSKISPQCGVIVTPSQPFLSYHSNSNASFTYVMTVLNENDAEGTYFLFPAGSTCHYVVIIIGTLVPRTLPGITRLCFPPLPYQATNVGVIGISGMTGLNLAT